MYSQTKTNSNALQKPFFKYGFGHHGQFLNTMIYVIMIDYMFAFIQLFVDIYCALKVWVGF